MGLRFLHFGDTIDAPHTWRQYDTANYIYDMYVGKGSLLKPTVCWMGSHAVTILEFPLPEFIIAQLYKLFGEQLFIARLVFLLFFCCALFYFYQSIKLLGSQKLARLATIIYALIPLGLFYSRAIHVDFTAVCFAHAMFYHYLLGIKHSDRKQVLLGSLFGILAFMVKAPYAFYFALPLIYYISRRQKWQFTFGSWWLLAIPLVVFLLWTQYTTAANEAAPDWNFLPHYRKFTNSWMWYFGEWHARFTSYSWDILLPRFRYGILGISGIVLGLVGLFNFKIKFEFRLLAFIWLLATVVYLFTFFNLNVYHDYYQVPFMAPMALLIAMGIIGLANWQKNRLVAALISIGLLVWFTQESIVRSEKRFFEEPGIYPMAGQVIANNTPDDALVIACIQGLDCRSPHLLYNARRHGWQLNQQNITAGQVYRLMLEGGTHLALVQAQPPPFEVQRITKFFKEEVIPIDDYYKLYLYELNINYLPPPAGELVLD